ncbi:protein SSX1-like [Psammomys obesus]|uniref:protein SSX1-like n=1 Tax=Psammomys obesus TaxID=48139 RepID=UPI002452B5FE|nr:protein SSX1-like [Psammomys obesus]
MMSFQNHTHTQTKKTDSSCAKTPVEVTHKSKKICKAFRDISTYFSEEEWANLTKWQKSAYVYMKRNYVRMTGLGITVNQPVFMRHKKQANNSLVECIEVHDSEDEYSEGTFGMTHRKSGKIINLRKVNGGLVSRDASVSFASKLPGNQVNAWSNRLRERKTRVIYEEISDPEEDDSDYFICK